MAETDYYSVLEVWPSASDDAIKEAYFKLAKVYHPDAANTGGIDPADQVEKFKLITEAYGVLSDPNKRRAYDASLNLKSQSKKAKSAGPETDKRAARLAFDQARVAMRHGQWDKASALLKTAIQHDDTNPSFHSWYGFSLAKMGTNLHEGRDACRKALQIEFYNADFHANLGYVYWRAGLRSTALTSFREALKWDSENAMAKKFVEKLGGNASEKKSGGGLMRFFKSFVSSS